MSDLITQVVSGAVTAMIGFAAAYALAQRQRRWDAEDAVAAARATLIRSARIPLELIREEIQAGWGLYYTREVEPEMTRRLREAIYALSDKALTCQLKAAVLHSGNSRPAATGRRQGRSPCRWSRGC